MILTELWITQFPTPNTLPTDLMLLQYISDKFENLHQLIWPLHLDLILFLAVVLFEQCEKSLILYHYLKRTLNDKRNYAHVSKVEKWKCHFLPSTCRRQKKDLHLLFGRAVPVPYDGQHAAQFHQPTWRRGYKRRVICKYTQLGSRQPNKPGKRHHRENKAFPLSFPEPLLFDVMFPIIGNSEEGKFARKAGKIYTRNLEEFTAPINFPKWRPQPRVQLVWTDMGIPKTWDLQVRI